MADIIVQEQAGELVVDSRLIAERLGIQHEALMRTINKYLTELQEFGVLRFENGKPENAMGGRPQRFVFLNEDQATLLMTMSRNTLQVVQCKVDLVSAFKKAKAIIPAQAARIRELELELELRKAEQKLIDTRHIIISTCPKLIADRILGIPVEKEIEYVDRTITPEGEKLDGCGITYLQNRYGFKSTSATWAWLDSIGFGKESGYWQDELVGVTRPVLPRGILGKLDDLSQGGLRQRFFGE